MLGKALAGTLVFILFAALALQFAFVQTRTRAVADVLIGDTSIVQDQNESPEISAMIAQGQKIPPALETLLQLEWRHSMSRIKRPLLLMRGMNYVMERDQETYNRATKANGVRITRGGSLSSVSGILCVGIGDLDEECVPGSRYPSLSSFQRISRLHGLRQIMWTKDAFCNTINTALAGFAGKYPGIVLAPFTFPCFTMPDQFNQLAKYANKQMQQGHTDMKWIIKPTDRGQGTGIYVVDGIKPLEQLKKDGSFMIVQPYMNDPYLIDGYKFDLRTYVLVTSISPLRVYMYREGLVRFASSKYDHNATAGGDPTQFLTNTSINKKYKDVNDLVWNYAKFKEHLVRVGEDPEEIFRRIYEAVVKVFISAEPPFRRHFSTLGKSYTCPQCYQLMGVDVIFDSMLRPKVIELNGSPDMHLTGQTGSSYDATKVGMMTNVIAMNYGRSSKLAHKVFRELHDLGVIRSSQKECLKAKPFNVDFALQQWNRARYDEEWNELQSNVFFDGSSGSLVGEIPLQTLDNLKKSELDTEGESDATIEESVVGKEYWQCIDDSEINTVLTTRRELEKVGGFVRIYPSRLTGNSVSVVTLLSHVAQKLPEGTKGTYYYHPLMMGLIGAQERVTDKPADKGAQVPGDGSA
eukprot:Opistho-1_new@59092